MKHAVVFCFGMVLAVAGAGCAKPGAEALVKQLLAAQEEQIAFSEDVRKGKIDLNKMERAGLQIADLTAQLAEMPKGEVDAAKAKYQDEFRKLDERKQKLNIGLPKIKPTM